jgi:hypothetical protein
MKSRLRDNKEFKMALCLAFTILIAAACPSTLAASERLSGIIVGSGVALINPFRILSIDDPLIDFDTYLLPWSLSTKDRQKLDRVYYPRARAELLEYDLMVFHRANLEHFTGKQVHDLDYAFREAGMAAFCALSGLGLGWVGPVLLGVIPINEREVSPYSRSYTARFREDRDPVFTPLLKYGIEIVFGDTYTEMYVKQGAKIWADIVPYGLPWLVSWRPGGGDPGEVWTVAHTFDGWWDEKNNPYVLDVATNMVFYSLDMELVSDIPARREARHLFRNARVQMSLILTMMNWADSFGARTDSLEERLLGLEKEAEKAAEEYIAQDYEPAISFLESLFEEVKLATEEAVRLKDGALLWVYTVEWLVVTGTCAGSGFMLWTVMVRRRSFREVETTRLTRPAD